VRLCSALLIELFTQRNALSSLSTQWTALQEFAAGDIFCAGLFVRKHANFTNAVREGLGA
jgi:hypothetical protein